ncbi:hypothetical protein Hanom_Chr10g00950441 [Helianthus anomalus]
MNAAFSMLITPSTSVVIWLQTQGKSTFLTTPQQPAEGWIIGPGFCTYLAHSCNRPCMSPAHSADTMLLPVKEQTRTAKKTKRVMEIAIEIVG